jgi:hypothetical protein
MTDATQLADRYIAMWNAADPEDRRDLIAGTWTEDGSYLDPLMKGDGHDGIDAMVAAVQAQFPDFRFSRTSAVDLHNDRLRFNWALGAEGREPLVAGLDVGVVAGDGRLASITGFLDKAPG